MPKNVSFRVTNESPQRERRAILRDERAAGTYRAFAEAEAGGVGGRYGAISKTQVTGVTAAPHYPTLPESSWVNQAAAVPAEEPTGIDVNAVEPTGTHAEIENSLREVHDGAGPLHPVTVGASSPGDAQRADTVARRRRPPNAKRRP